MTKLLQIIIFIFIITQISFANNNSFINKTEYSFNKAKIFFNNKRYELARLEFIKAKNNIVNENYFLNSKIDFYIVKCAIKLKNLDANLKLLNFIKNNSNSKYLKEAYFLLANLEYKNKRYKKAIKFFNKYKQNNLTFENKEIEYNFKLGYSYLMIDSNNCAIDYFYKIKDKESEYQMPAIYYYSHLEYLNNNYNTALKGFNQVIYDLKFVEIANYYIVKIHYQLGEYEKTISKAIKLLESQYTSQKKELYKVIGESYLSLKNYSQSVSYLLKYKQLVKNFARNECYNLAYAYYKINELDPAIAYFKKAIKGEDKMAQNAYYFLANCYLKQKNYSGARESFRLASELEFDKNIKEDSYFNFAKLSYQLQPLKDMDNEVKAFIDFIEKYPNSNRIDEAYNYLIDAFTNTRKYKTTLEYIEKIKNKTPNILVIKQNISLNRGIELFNNLKFEESIIFFNEALKLKKFNKEIAAKSIYYKAEANYRLKKYSIALDLYKQFQLSPGAYGLPEFNISYYNIAYSLFKLNQYSSSIPWFKKFINNCNDFTSNILADTYLRLGDCSFLSKNYKIANSYYQGIQKLKTDKKDYALFQSGITYGLLDLYNEKINQLELLLISYPKSPYSDDALFELGKTYILTRKIKQSILTYNKLFKNYNYSKFAPKSKLQLGLIYYNQKKYQESLTEYKIVIENYPKTTNAKTALLAIKNIYTDINKPDDYISYIDSRENIEDISVSEKEKLFYNSAENLYVKENYAEAAKSFEKYINKFPKGMYIVKANFYCAESLFEMKNYTKSLNFYEFILTIPNSEFLHSSIKKSAFVNFNDSNYVKAIKYYNLLEQNTKSENEKKLAYIGQMKSYNKISDIDNSILYAKKVKKIDKISIKLIKESNLILSENYKKKGNIDEMIKAYEALSNYIDSEIGAEAKYKIIKFYFDKELYELVEKETFDFAKKNTSQRHWLAKSFILLSKIYIKKNNNFQAKATLKSILNNYDNEKDSVVINVKKLLANINENEMKNELKAKEDNKQKIQIKVEKE